MDTTHQQNKNGITLWLFAGAFGFYLLTMSPGVFWMDSAQLQVRSLEGWELTPDARHYFLFTILLKLIAGPLSSLGMDYALACNIVTAAIGALGVVLAWHTLAALGMGVAGRLAGAISLMASHTYWQASVVTEVYGLYVVLLLAMLVCALRWKNENALWLYGCLFFCGLGIAHHRLALLSLPGLFLYFIWKRHRLSWKTLLLGALSFLAGFSPMLAAGAVYLAEGNTLPELVGVFLFSENIVWKPFAIGSARTPVFLGTAYLLVFLLYNFAGPAALLGWQGAKRLTQKKWAEAGLLWMLLLAGAAFGIGYNVEDKWIFYFPVYVVFSLFAGAGASDLVSWAQGRWPGKAFFAQLLLLSLLLVPMLTYATLPRVMNIAGLNVFKRASHAQYQEMILHPNLRWNAGPLQFARKILHAVPPGAVLFADPSCYYVLQYLRATENAGTEVSMEFLGIFDHDNLVKQFANVDRNKKVYIALWPYQKLSAMKNMDQIATRVSGKETLFHLKEN